MWILLWTACTDAPKTAETLTDGPELPGHNDCLPEGEVMSDEICLAVVEEDGRLPTTSHDASNMAPLADDPRLTDPDYLWLQSEIERCTCRCCHTTGLGGPGVHRWDLAYKPVWIDSASDWALDVLRGETDEYEQTLPSSDPDRVWETIGLELTRRE